MNEILKDKANSWAIANSPGKVADQYGTLIGETKKYLDLLAYIEKQTKTFEQTTQEAIDANLAALDHQAKVLQNQFDLNEDNIKLKADIKLAEDAIKELNDDIDSYQGLGGLSKLKLFALFAVKLARLLADIIFHDNEL